MHIISLNKKEFKAPSKWTELTAAGLLVIALVIGSQLQPEFINSFLAMRLFEIPKKQFFRLKRCQQIQLEPLFKWIYTKNELQAWLIKRVKVTQINYYGPADRLADLTADEFMYAEAAYERWIDTEKEEFLHTLFAVLYRKKVPFRFKKYPFDSDKLDSAMKATKRVRLYIKKAVAINYAGCRNLMIKRHPDIWKSAGEGDNNPSGPKVTNWASIILELSGDKFGTYEQTIKTNIWLLLADLNKKAKDYTPNK